MAITYAYTLEEARTLLQLYKDAERELVLGQAKSYRIGSRELTLFDIEDIRRQIQYFSDAVEVLSGATRRTRVARVVPRDL